MYNSIIEFLNSEKKVLDKIAENAKSEFNKLYSIDTCVKKYISLYKKLLNEN